MDESVSFNSSITELAAEVAGVLAKRANPKDLIKLFQIVFWEVSEAAELLRVKPKTVYTWISQRKIPVRYAGGRPVFLLAELLNWTLPERDEHQATRLSIARSCKIAIDRLATGREREKLDAGL